MLNVGYTVAPTGVRMEIAVLVCFVAIEEDASQHHSVQKACGTLILMNVSKTALVNGEIEEVVKQGSSVMVNIVYYNLNVHLAGGVPRMIVNNIVHGTDGRLMHHLMPGEKPHFVAKGHFVVGDTVCQNLNVQKAGGILLRVNVRDLVGLRGEEMEIAEQGSSVVIGHVSHNPNVQKECGSLRGMNVCHFAHMLGEIMLNVIEDSSAMADIVHTKLHAHLAGGMIILMNVKIVAIVLGEIPEIVERDFSVMVRHVGQSPSVQRGGGVIIPVK